jgi:hypothetical protein
MFPHPRTPRIFGIGAVVASNTLVSFAAVGVAEAWYDETERLS